MGYKMKNRLGRVVEAGVVDFVEQEVKQPVGTQILVKIKASCICGSDLHIYRGKHPGVRLPVTIGHEFAGEVMAVGEDAIHFRKGDRVVVEPSVPCGNCDACRHGEYSYCENINFTYRLGDGAMADYFLGKEEFIYPLTDDISYEKGALTEPLAVAVHACKRAGISLGDKVLVIGSGAIGIMITAVCRKLGAREVVVTDLSECRLAMAKMMGATHTLNAAGKDIKQAAREWTEGKGFDKKVNQGDHVKKGDLLLEFDLHIIEEAGLSAVTPVIVTNPGGRSEISHTQADTVKPGDDFLTIR